MYPIRALRFALGCAGFVLIAASALAANRPVPEAVNLKVFARIEGDHLELLVRLPLAAVKDIQFPTRGEAGYLDLEALDSMLQGVSRYWIAGCFEVFERGAPVSRPEIGETRLSVTADRSFDSYQTAAAHLAAPGLSSTENVFWDQVWLDARLRYGVRGDDSVIAIAPAVAGLGVRVSTDLRYVAHDGSIREFSFDGNPGLIYLDARRRDAGRQFLAWGAKLVLGSADFLLFVFCLAFPFHRYRECLPSVVTFVGSLLLALVASLWGLAPDAAWFRPLIEGLEATAVLLAALANIVGGVTPRRRALFALGSGFIFGCGCAFDLGTRLQFGGSHPVVSGAAFYAGVVVAMSALVTVLIPVLSVLFSFARVETLERMIVSALAADTAWGWLDERWAELRRVPLQFVFDAEMTALALRSLAVLVVVGGLLWFVNEWLKSSVWAADESVRPRDSRTAG